MTRTVTVLLVIGDCLPLLEFAAAPRWCGSKWLDCHYWGRDNAVSFPGALVFSLQVSNFHRQEHEYASRPKVVDSACMAGVDAVRECWHTKRPQNARHILGRHGLIH